MIDHDQLTLEEKAWHPNIDSQNDSDSIMDDGIDRSADTALPHLPRPRRGGSRTSIGGSQKTISRRNPHPSRIRSGTMVPIPLQDNYLPPTAELDLDEFHAEIMQSLQLIMAAGGQGIKGVTIGMDNLSTEARNTNLQLLMVQSQVEEQE